MQAVMSCQKLIDRPGAEDSLLRLMHLEMKLVPRPVMKGHGSYEDGRPLPRDRRDKSSDWHSLYRRLTHRQPYLLVFTRSDRLIAEYLGVMLVMHQSVSLKHALDGRHPPTQEVPSVHQPAVHLVLEKGHHDTGEDEPAAKLKNRHQISATPSSRSRPGGRSHWDGAGSPSRWRASRPPGPRGRRTPSARPRRSGAGLCDRARCAWRGRRSAAPGRGAGRR